MTQSSSARTSSRRGLVGRAARAAARTATGCRASRGRASPRRRRSARRRRARRRRRAGRRRGSPAPAARRRAAPRARSRACPCGAPRRERGWKPIAATPASSTSRWASSKPSVSPGRGPERSLTVTGRPLPSRAARATATARVGVLDQRGAGAGLADLRHRAAHVEVDEVGAALGDRGGGRAHDVGVLAEELDRDRPARALLGVDAQQLAHRLLVAVVDREARHHLRDREPGAVALGLQAHEPVADPGQRRQHDAVFGSAMPTENGRSAQA